MPKVSEAPIKKVVDPSALLMWPELQDNHLKTRFCTQAIQHFCLKFDVVKLPKVRSDVYLVEVGQASEGLGGLKWPNGWSNSTIMRRFKPKKIPAKPYKPMNTSQAVHQLYL